MFEPKVIDNFLPESYQNDIESLMTSNKFNWFYKQHICSAGSSPEEAFLNKNVTHSIGFYHTIYDIVFGGDVSEHSVYFKNILYFFEHTTNLKIDELLRIRCRLTTQQPNHTEKNYNVPHLDYCEYKDNHVGFCYYVNDSDGNTNIYDVKDEDYVKNNDILLDPPISYSCPPKKGRILLFDGELFHSGNCPINHKHRITINFDLTVK